MKAEVYGARLFVKAESKADLTKLMTVIKHFPQSDQQYWLVLDTTEVDKSCDIRPINNEQT